MNDRYATPAMAGIWSEERRNDIERHIWISVLKAQQAAGMAITDEQVAAYVTAREDIANGWVGQFHRIDEIEAETRHDLVARLRYFNEVAGLGLIHQGMTSADVVENTVQIVMVQAADQIVGSCEQVMSRLLSRAEQADSRPDGTPLVARTHGQPAQLTTLGKRYADWSEGLGRAMYALSIAMNTMRPRGLKGAVGTYLDLACLIEPSCTSDPEDPMLSWRLAADRAREIDHGTFSLAVDGPGGERVTPLRSVGQCYPRSLDLPLVSAVLQVASACERIAVDLRALSMLDLVGEGMGGSQVGSSAMPHKRNPRYCERVCSLAVVARGYTAMLNEVAGGVSWLEGDVATSAARRIALPGLFTTVDAMLANIGLVLRDIEHKYSAMDADVARSLPLLVSGQLLALATESGLDRTIAHGRLMRLAHAATEEEQPATAFMTAVLDDDILEMSYTRVLRAMSIPRLVAPARLVVREVLRAVPLFDGARDEWPDWEIV